MKRYIIFILITLFLVTVSWLNTFADDLDNKEKALTALKTKNYSTAIDICLQQLRENPQEYDFNLILSKAYAFSRQWEKSLIILNRMLKLYPDSTEVLLAQARIYIWKKNYEQAGSKYTQVLALEPQNIEALKGAAEVAFWKKDFSRAIVLYQQILQSNSNHPDVYYRLGLIWESRGDYLQARKYFKKAAHLDPENKIYEHALKRTNLVRKETIALWYQYRLESFSDHRDNYLNHRFTLRFKAPSNLATIFLSYDKTKRFNKWDTQYEIELYPRLWRKAYAFLNFSYSHNAIYYPQTSYLGEVYQSLLSVAEISAGYRRMNFKSKSVSIYLGSLGYYFGKYYSYLRLYYVPEEKGKSLSWLANLRRYFSDGSYFFIGYGQGSKPFEIITLEDALITQSRVFLTGFDYYFLRKIKLQFYFSHRRENNGLKRNVFFAIVGYRW